MNSLTTDFVALLHSRIDQKYSTDGPTLLFTMCFHLHRNHLAFLESIKNKIRLSTLVEFKNDVPSFLRFLQDNLHLITSTGAADNANNDLIHGKDRTCRLYILTTCFYKIAFFQKFNAHVIFVKVTIYKR